MVVIDPVPGLYYTWLGPLEQETRRHSNEVHLLSAQSHDAAKLDARRAEDQYGVIWIDGKLSHWSLR